jgi:sugar phosphate isomerase/epimerase
MLIGLGSYIFRYAIGNSAFRPKIPMDPIHFVKKAAEFKVDLVQFADNLPLELFDHQDLKKLKAVAERLGIILEAGMAGAREDSMLKQLEVAELIGSKMVRLAPHAQDVHADKDSTLQVLKEVLPKYKRAGVSISIENHFTMSSEDLIELVDTVNSALVGICLDTGNSIVQHEWPLETVSKLAPYANSLHMKDYILEPHPNGVGAVIRGVPLGEGKQQINQVLDTLDSFNKKINMILETWMLPAESPELTLKMEEEWIGKSVAAARAILKQRGK